ncbi:MAG: type II toxin-antitoxin system RelE/ParE family toxin [bacterium]
MSEKYKFEVILSDRAFKYYRRLDRKMTDRLDRCFEMLEIDPFGGGDIKPLEGREKRYRCRVGNLRVIFRVNLEERRVEVSAILPRGDAY